MSSVRLQFVLGADFSSRLIAWYGQGYGGFSHVDAVLPDGSLLGARSDRVGGKPPGVQIRSAGYETWKRREVVEIPCEFWQAGAWLDCLEAKVGDEYDKGAIIAFITGDRDHDQGHWICSAAQTDALETAQLLPSLPVPPQQVTPDALRLIAYSIGGRCVASA